jgi:hypothetical protein
VAKKTQLTVWIKISTGSSWNLGHSLLAENFACGKKAAVDFLEQNFHRLSMESWRKTLRVAKKPQLIFWNKISTGFPWNLEHSLLVENFACGKKTVVDFLEQNFLWYQWRKSR